MEIRYSITASRALRRCEKRELIRQKIGTLAEDPLALKANVKALNGRSDYRLRVQNWRVISQIADGVLEIKDVVPRGSAYKE